MPKRFQFEVKNDEDKYELAHQEILKATRCHGHTRNGTRCKRQCIIGYEYCPAHLASEKHLKIATSTLDNAGNGLFAYDKTKGDDDVVFQKDDVIMEYHGRVKSDEEIEEQYQHHTAPYTVRAKQDMNIDAAGQRGVASLTNHRARSYINCELKTKKDRGRIIGIQLVALKNIKNYSELFCNYGDTYNFNEDTRYSTKPYYPRK
jgi:hypothetical protein